jgi:hypothetical protein
MKGACLRLSSSPPSTKPSRPDPRLHLHPWLIPSRKTNRQGQPGPVGHAHLRRAPPNEPRAYAGLSRGRSSGPRPWPRSPYDFRINRINGEFGPRKRWGPTWTRLGMGAARRDRSSPVSRLTMRQRGKAWASRLPPSSGPTKSTDGPRQTFQSRFSQSRFLGTASSLPLAGGRAVGFNLVRNRPQMAVARQARRASGRLCNCLISRVRRPIFREAGDELRQTAQLLLANGARPCLESPRSPAADWSVTRKSAHPWKHCPARLGDGPPRYFGFACSRGRG